MTVAPPPGELEPFLPRWQDKRTAGALTPPPPRAVDGLAIDTPPRWRKPFGSPWYFNPAWRFFMFVVFFIVAAAAFVLPFATGQGPEIASSQSIAGASQLGGAVVAYLLVVLTFEKRRPPAELAPGRIAGLFTGLALGAVLIGVVTLLLFVLGVYHVDGVDPHYDWAETVFLVGAVAGISEEIMFRGILFRLVEEGLGTWGALVISALVFGLVHVSNPNSSLIAGLSIALEAGVLIALVYALTRSLWVVIGLHAAWNVVQGPVFGFPVSGATEGGFIRSHVTGPQWLSGGAFGAEASLVSVIFMTLVAVGFAIVLVRRGEVISPAWVRRRRQRELLAAHETSLTRYSPTPDPSDPASRPVS